MIDLQYNEVVVVKRLSDVAGTNKKEFVTSIASLSCHIQPLEAQISADIEGGFGKEWLMFCEVDDIAEGDRVFRSAKEYRVTGVERFEFMDHAHMEVSIRIFES